LADIAQVASGFVIGAGRPLATGRYLIWLASFQVFE